MSQKSALSKSQFIKGQQCPKALWLYRRRKELKPQWDEETVRRFTVGTNVGELAKQYFPFGVTTNSPYWQIEQTAQQTRSLLAEGEDIVFEAGAIDPETQCYSRIDVLRKGAGGSYDLIEVKSATRTKPYHFNDMAFQHYVFSAAGYSIAHCYMMLIDTNYVRSEELEVQKLFYLEDIYPYVRTKERQIYEQIIKLQSILRNKEEPEIQMGEHCTSPFFCEYRDYCQGLYQQKIERDSMLGGLFSGCSTKSAEEPDVLSARKGSCKPNLLSSWLIKLEYPLFFLDYECFQSPVPLFAQSRPYQQIPFQFSLHVQDEADGIAKYFVFLHRQQTDPRRSMLEALRQYIGSHGSVIVYGKPFEKNINKQLGYDFPEYQEFLQSINQRLIDLLLPFQKYWLYSPAQNGSVSLKTVLPAFTGLSYEGLAIANGADAMQKYFEFISGQLPPEDCEALWRNLLEYSQLDTYAMVQLLAVLRQKAALQDS